MLKITRGRVYHNLKSEFKDIVLTIFSKNIYQESKILEFESKLASRIGRKYAKSMPFARYALYTILKYKNFPQGSEIIMPPITIKPMVDIVIMCGLKPVFVDIELDTLCFDDKKLEQSITANTKAILITYLFGIVPDMNNILKIAKKYNLYTIEDFSHNINSQYNNKNIGTLGNVSIYSSSSLKTVDSYIGGTVLTDDEKLYLHLKSIECKLPKMPRIFLIKKIILNMVRNIFSKRFIFTFVTSPLLTVIKKLNYNLYKKVLGARLNLSTITSMPIDWSYRFTSIQANRGLEQLNQVDLIDKSKIQNIKVLKQYLSQEFHHLLPKELPSNKNVYWQYPIYIEQKEQFLKYLENTKLDMGTTNLSLCAMLEIYPKYKTHTPNALKVKHNYMFIPTYIGLTTKDMIYIAQTLNEFLRNQYD